MKKLIGLGLVGIIIVLAFNFLNIITMNNGNNGKDLLGNNYYMEGYGKGDIVLVVENSYYEIVADLKIN